MCGIGGGDAKLPSKAGWDAKERLGAWLGDEVRQSEL